MERLGFIHNKLEIKMLILFVLNRLPHPVSLNDLTELVMCDDGISYFDFTDCLAELVETEHVTAENELYSIALKGVRNGTVTESSIPYSVRLKAERSAMKLSRIMKRSAMIKTDTNTRNDGGYTVSLSLSDGIGDIMSINIFAGSEAQANTMEKHFQKNAEELYNGIVSLLLNS